MSGQGPPASGPDLCSLGFTVPCARVLEQGRVPPWRTFLLGSSLPICFSCATAATSNLLRAVVTPFWLFLMTTDIKTAFGLHCSQGMHLPQPLNFGCLQLPFFLRAGAVVGCVAGMALTIARLKVESWVFHLLAIWPWESYLSLRTEYPHLYCGFSYTYSAV